MKILIYKQRDKNSHLRSSLWFQVAAEDHSFLPQTHSEYGCWSCIRRGTGLLRRGRKTKDGSFRCSCIWSSTFQFDLCLIQGWYLVLICTLTSEAFSNITHELLFQLDTRASCCSVMWPWSKPELQWEDRSLDLQWCSFPPCHNEKHFLQDTIKYRCYILFNSHITFNS